MISRALRDRPELVKVAQQEIDRLREAHGDHELLVEWHDILKLPVWRIRRLLTSRDERMFRLRIDSPFIRPLIHEFGFDDEDGQRRRIIAASRRLVSHGRPQFIIERPITMHEILTAWSKGKMTDEEVSAALHLDDDDDLAEIAGDNDIPLPSPPEWFIEEPIVDRSSTPGQS